MRLEEMAEVDGNGENDVAMEVPEGYRALCVVCGQPARSKRDDAGKLCVNSFSFGTSENTAFCIGLAFLCEEHEHSNAIFFSLLARIGMIAKSEGAA